MIKQMIKISIDVGYTEAFNLIFFFFTFVEK